MRERISDDAMASGIKSIRQQDTIGSAVATAESAAEKRIPKTDTLDAYRFKKVQLQRSFLRRTLMKGETKFPITQTERTVLIASCDLGDLHDSWYAAWRKDVMSEPLHQQLSTLHGEARTYLKEKGAAFDPDAPFLYHTFHLQPDGHIIAPLYAEAFPQHVAKISTRVTKLLADLETLNVGYKQEGIERKNLVTYYQAFDRAITSRNVSELKPIIHKANRVGLYRQCMKNSACKANAT